MSTTTGISLKTLHAELAQAQAEVKGIADNFPADEQGRFSIPTEMHANYVKAVKKAKEVKGLVDAHRDAAEIDSYLAGADGISEGARDAGLAGGGAEFKSLGEMFTESSDYKAAVGNGLRKSDLQFMRAEMEGKSLFSLAAGTVTHQTLGQAQHTGFHDIKRRQFHIRDLFNKSTTKAAVLYGVRETGWVNNAEQIKERNADGSWYNAPTSHFNLEPVMYPVAEIAHITQAHKNILADEPRLKQWINTRMIEGLKFKEDYDLLHSIAGPERVTGLFKVEGTQKYTGLAKDKYSVQIRRAITKAQLAEYEPDGLVISPEMWEHLEVETDDNGAFRIALQVAVGAQKRLWQLGVISTTAMADEDFLIGSFQQGATLHDRETVSVTVSTENGTTFEQGVVTVRADERLALEVHRPESFVLGKWTEPGSEEVVGG